MGVGQIDWGLSGLANHNEVTRQLTCIQETPRIQESYQMQVQAEEQQRQAGASWWQWLWSESRTRLDFRVTWSPLTAASNCLWKRSQGNFYSKPKLPHRHLQCADAHTEALRLVSSIIELYTCVHCQSRAVTFLKGTMEGKSTWEMYQPNWDKSSNSAPHRWHQGTGNDQLGGRWEYKHVWHLPCTRQCVARPKVFLGDQYFFSIISRLYWR